MPQKEFLKRLRIRKIKNRICEIRKRKLRQSQNLASYQRQQQAAEENQALAHFSAQGPSQFFASVIFNTYQNYYAPMNLLQNSNFIPEINLIFIPSMAAEGKIIRIFLKQKTGMLFKCKLSTFFKWSHTEFRIKLHCFD